MCELLGASRFGHDLHAYLILDQDPSCDFFLEDPTSTICVNLRTNRQKVMKILPTWQLAELIKVVLLRECSDFTHYVGATNFAGQ